MNELILSQLKQDLSDVTYGKECIFKLIKDYKFDTVLDIGTGMGQHAKLFSKYGKVVDTVDFCGNNVEGLIRRHYCGDYNSLEISNTYDCIWCCHVLEHQENVGFFLKKIIGNLKGNNSCLAITVPPAKSEIVSGHVSLWNPVLLLYRLILAGLDCSEAVSLTYGYNISVILKKKMINVSDLRADSLIGVSLQQLLPYFPIGINPIFDNNGKLKHIPGDIKDINWT